ncbi:MAG: 6-bladed beta-propeller [Acidobacteriota bacterium]|nr:6-bladed beta-propeller [Acidobacteriota bacterium]
MRLKNKTSYHVAICFLCTFSMSAFLSCEKKTTERDFEGLSVEAAIRQKAEVVNNPKTPVPRPGRRKKLVFEEKITIGVSEGDENHIFGQSLYVNMDDGGNFYVTDWDRKHIRKFSPDGKYLLAIGGPGQGPGEFQNVWGPKFDSSGNLYVRDIANQKISFFSKSGEFIKGINAPQDVSDVTILPNGNYFTSKTERIEDPKVVIYMLIYGIYDTDFHLLKEFEQVKQEIRQRETKTRAQFFAGILSDSAYKPRFLQEITEEGKIHTGNAVTYEIKIYSQEGDLQRRITREYQPIQVTQSHKDNFFEVQSIDLLRRLPTGDSFKEEVLKHMEYPKFLPPYTWFSVMDNGWLYVVADAIEGDYALIDLFDEQGIYIGRFQSNLPAAQVFFKNGLAYAVVTEDDYKCIKAYTYKIVNY